MVMALWGIAIHVLLEMAGQSGGCWQDDYCWMVGGDL